MTPKIIHNIKELIKDIRYFFDEEKLDIDDIRYFFDEEKLDIDDIPPMRYPKGYTGRKGPDPDNKPDWMINDRNRVLRLKYKGMR